MFYKQFFRIESLATLLVVPLARKVIIRKTEHMARIEQLLTFFFSEAFYTNLVLQFMVSGVQLLRIFGEITFHLEATYTLEIFIVLLAVVNNLATVLGYLDNVLDVEVFWSDWYMLFLLLVKVGFCVKKV